ncbi:photosystem I reaction centre, subunit VIII [Monoraphidium neglectum]|uniref:Photosystem I reaction center subunit VIII n=1 Tax=Monoraphidium neglectum TaxID=145388 RepID=A0A0D2M1V1_9CHLO|nr:photosystem I reaction centre, subunit VIII [Monoraphidium neglectum]KIY97609.1 photosystem I reaction centre, subunit VIII [Monoraphidium neglectum]|eukprot:XP_013896629.1 photosystem I reaction centre, subunit VIII [Monoraphidium neglectum]
MLATKSVSAVRPVAASRSLAVRPVAKAQASKATLAAAAAVVALSAAHPAEAQQLVATVASAAEGYPFVPPEYLPSVLVPTVGLIVPAIAMAWAFSWIEKEKSA